MAASRLNAAAPESDERCLVIQPNASLTPRQAKIFFLSMCGVSFGIAGLLTLQGFWVVLPFAGLEMAALGAGLWWSMRSNHYKEVIRVQDDRLLFQSGQGGPEKTREFHCAWAQVLLEAGVNRNDQPRLLLRSHGRDCEFGRCLTAEEKQEVARRLRGWLKASHPLSGSA